MPGSGNAGAGFDSHGDMESLALRVHGTWNLLARRLTPFLTAGAGVVFLDPTLARFSYGAGAGLRFELPRNHGFMRAFVGGEWIEISEAASRVGYVQFRADFGLRF